MCCLSMLQLGMWSCACGAEQRQLPCQERHFQCTRVCGKVLPCGRHKCDQVCHAGSCGGCLFEGQRCCPCGKTIYSDMACDEKAPTCGETCGKKLSCGVHRCTERCHYGDCSKVCTLRQPTCQCHFSCTQVWRLCHELQRQNDCTAVLFGRVAHRVSSLQTRALAQGAWLCGCCQEQFRL